MFLGLTCVVFVGARGVDVVVVVGRPVFGLVWVYVWVHFCAYSEYVKVGYG